MIELAETPRERALAWLGIADGLLASDPTGAKRDDQSRRCSVILGNSGSGKSTLARASGVRSRPAPRPRQRGLGAGQGRRRTRADASA
ncbi:MAG: hypothetical protein IPJ77_21465 [Planctomycetes bacterium]|nr:hypothetical protein [Planctomycetota bacterium]